MIKNYVCSIEGKGGFIKHILVFDTDAAAAKFKDIVEDYIKTFPISFGSMSSEELNNSSQEERNERIEKWIDELPASLFSMEITDLDGTESVVIREGRTVKL